MDRNNQKEVIIDGITKNAVIEYINEQYSQKISVNENDGDDMSIYKVLDDKVYDICYRHGFNVQTKVEKDGSYHAVFLADSRNETVKEAITMIEALGLKKVQFGDNWGDFIHHYFINFS